MWNGRRLAWMIGLGLAMLVVGAANALAAAGIYEVPGNPKDAPSSTFKSYKTETGLGPDLKDHRSVLISCRVKGKAVADGNVWWYRIAEKPWNDRYYVSADDFYNDGRTSGSLKGTPYFDPKVPLCK